MKYSGWSESFSNLLASSCMLSFIFKIAADSVWSCKESDLLVGKCHSTKHRGPQGKTTVMENKQKNSCSRFLKKQTNQGGDVYRNRSSSDWKSQFHLLFLAEMSEIIGKWKLQSKHQTITPMFDARFVFRMIITNFTNTRFIISSCQTISFLVIWFLYIMCHSEFPNPQLLICTLNFLKKEKPFPNIFS